MKYRKRPLVIDAYRWDGQPSKLMAWVVGFDSSYVALRFVGDGRVGIPTLEGEMLAQAGDWIIRGVKGEFYPCKPDIFAETYEPAALVGGTRGQEHPK